MLLDSSEIRKLETSFLLLFEKTLFKGIKGRPAHSYLRSVKTQFKSKTFQVQIDRIINDVYLRSIDYTDKRLGIKKKKASKSASFSAAAAKPLPITEEAVRQASSLSKEVTESVIRILKDDGLYLEHPNKLEKRVRDIWGNQKHKAIRFTRTFTADVATNTELWRYQDSGIDDLQFYAKIDDKTSPQCRMLHGTIFRADSPEVRRYRPPLHFHCRSDLIPVPVTRKVDPKMRFENRNFSRSMDQKFNPLDDRVDKDLIDKTFEDIDTFNEKYRIDQFILDEDLEARLQKLNVQVLTELPSGKSRESIIRDYEVDIKKRKTEKAILFDEKGNILLEKTGGVDYVSFTDEEVKLFEGTFMTHNHPRSSSFSMQDISLACRSKLKEIRAAGKFRTYIMKAKNGENLYPDLWYKKISDVYEYHNSEVRREFLRKIDNGELSIEDAELLHSHEVWTRAAKDISDLDYSYIEEKT
ncbi:TPA: phage head morphogenesis protein [Methanosarcina acetivorans]|uniref:Phage head morphogenesis domain-containing protein n=2 Tax=Methanosarcina acetivorans TaxID=2214 RepID=Q8TJG2_METAC|nr:phage head morphogenesis protein [Methanosarcina acetivorans]AAM07174.1 hypothetical protein (multi-domain) [Methanosarcina acetivorans C2A]HIH93626.1 phage head morphogenesis protein [Methanosarcina acetivorans]